MTNRKPISVKTRFDVFKRDFFTCQYCGSKPPAAILHIDHIHPVSKGGDNAANNLITACNLCNLGKGARSLASVPKSLQDRAAEIKESEKQIRAYNKLIRGQKERLDSEVWEVVRYLKMEDRHGLSVPRKDYQSIANFINKIGLFETIEAAEIASTRRCAYSNKFKYFCGICWNKFREARNARA